MPPKTRPPAGPAARKIPRTYRLAPETLAIIAAIGEIREGLSDTRVIENAVEIYGKQVLGRRLNDLVAIRLREADAER